MDLCIFSRGLQFMLAFVEAMAASEDGSMGAVFKKAYAVTLQKYHSWIVQKALTVGFVERLAWLCAMIDVAMEESGYK